MSSDASTLPLRDAPVGGTKSPSLRRTGRRVDVFAGASTQAWVGAVALALVVALSLLIVVMVADRPSGLSPTTHTNYFPHWMAGPLGGLWPGLTRNGTALRWLFTGALAAMYGGYLVVLACVPQLRARWAVVAVVAAHAVYFLAPPLALTDVFNYINYGRMEVVHHLNPYTTTPIFEPNNDPSYALSNWHQLLSPYGPLFTLLTFALVPLGVAASFWTIKGILALASLATIALVWKCARLLGRDPVAAIVLVGLNPIVLVWGLGGDHNDFLMVLFIVLAFYLLLLSRSRSSQTKANALGELATPAEPYGRGDSETRREPRAPAQSSSPARRLSVALSYADVGAGAALIVAVAIKASAGVLIPVVLAGLLRSRNRLKGVVLGMAAAAVVVGAASLVAFGPHTPDLSTQSSLVTSLSVPNLLGLALGAGGETATLHTLLTLALAASLLMCCVMAWRERASLTACGWASIALLVTLSWVLPWYVLWVLPLAALSSSRRLRRVTLWLGVYLIIAWAPASGLVWSAIGFHPERTRVGRLHHEAVKELLN
jgi:hypothetical protein